MRYLTTTEAAAALKVNQSRIRQLCRAGLATGAKRMGRDWLIPENALSKLAKRPKAGRPRAAPKEKCK